MLAQQLEKPLPGPASNVQTPQGHLQTNVQSASCDLPVAPVSVVTTTSAVSQPHGSEVSHGEHTELPESITAELEKLEQENSVAGVEAEHSELVDLGMDDDELLGMGADFNILEYADPDLCCAIGTKTNILDNLDLEEEKDEDKDENKDKRKEEGGKYVFKQCRLHNSEM